MRLQERNDSNFDELVCSPPPAAEASVSSCVQALATSLGFAVSAGWDWLPSMHTLWLHDFIKFFGMDIQQNAFSGSIFFKMAMLLAFCPLMERLFHAFPLGGVMPRNPKRPRLARIFFPAALCERIYLCRPLIILQFFGILILLAQGIFYPGYDEFVSPLVLGTISALFGLIWFLLIVILPGIWSCIAYGMAITFSVLLSLVLDSISFASLGYLRLLFPLMALLLLPLAIPSAKETRQRILRHRRQLMFGSQIKGVFIREVLLHRFSSTDMILRWGNLYVVLLLFPLMYGIQLLLDYSSGCPLVCISNMNNPPLERHTFLVLSGEISGVFLASTLLAFFPSHYLLVPMTGLSLFGCGSLMTSIFPAPPLNSIAFYIMQMASGACAAFGLFVLHLFSNKTGFLIRTLSKMLFLLTLYSSMGGYLLWTLANSIHNVYLTSHELFMHLLTLGAILGLLVVYLLCRPLRLLQANIPPVPLEHALTPKIQENPFALLTPREKQVAELVRSGMKNLEISVQLNITETTLRVHLRRIYRKLGIQGRTNLREFNKQ